MGCHRQPFEYYEKIMGVPKAFFQCIIYSIKEHLRKWILQVLLCSGNIYIHVLLEHEAIITICPAVIKISEAVIS